MKVLIIINDAPLLFLLLPLFLPIVNITTRISDNNNDQYGKDAYKGRYKNKRNNRELICFAFPYGEADRPFIKVSEKAERRKKDYYQKAVKFCHFSLFCPQIYRYKAMRYYN